jgi:hypothetical protein
MASAKWTDDKDIGKKPLIQVPPPFVVLAIPPPHPTTHPVESSMKKTSFSQTDGPDELY